MYFATTNNLNPLSFVASDWGLFFIIMENQYRVLEQYGKFFLQKFITREQTVIEKGKPTGKKEEVSWWHTLKDKNIEHGGIDLEFDSKNQAIAYIPKLKPVYHEITQEEINAIAENALKAASFLTEKIEEVNNEIPVFVVESK